MIKTSKQARRSTNNLTNNNINKQTNMINQSSTSNKYIQQPTSNHIINSPQLPQQPSSYKNINNNNKFTQVQFMKFYQENIKLKKQLQQKNHHIHQLRKKLQQQLNLNKTVAGGYSNNAYDQLKQLKTQVKKSGPQKGNSSASKNNKTFYNTILSNGQSKKLQNLLQIIQSYKQKLLISQDQCMNLKRQKILLQQQLKLGTRGNNIKNNSFNENKSKQRQQQNNSYSLQKKYDQLITKLRQKTSQLQLEKQRNKFVQAELRRLQTRQRTLQMDADTLQELKVQNRILQQRIMKLTMITDTATDGQSDYRSLENKNRQLETKLKAGLEKYNKIKQDKTKVQIDYKLLQNKVIEIQHQLQQSQQENLKLKKNQVNDPVIQRLIKDKLLLAQVIGEIQQPSQKNNSTKKQHTTFQSTHKLLMEKQSLAKELVEVKNKMKLLEQSWREKQTMIQIQKQEMLALLKSVPQQNNGTNNKFTKSYTSKQGVQYDGDISMFSDQRIAIAQGVNYFDIYLGRVNLIDSLLKTVTPLNTSSPLLMATVDFYNFPTENTKLSQGMVADLNTQFVFKISQEEFFYKFLMKDNMKISVWATQGNKNCLIGQVDVLLKQLIMRNKPNIAPVINTSAPIINGQKVVGTIFFDLRMRLPIFQQASKIISQPLSGLKQEIDKQIQQRKLIIQIDEGSGFKQSSKLFVYYQFRLEDYYTRTSPGPVPKWGHYKMIDLKYDQQTKNYLKRNELQLTVFDDSVQLNDKDGDVIGTGIVSLIGLVQNKVIRQKLTIRKNGIITGTIQVKLFWYQSSIKQKHQQSSKQQQKSKQQLLWSMHVDILQHINVANSTAERQFKKIDSNSTGMVSFDQFNMWFIRIKQSHKYSRDLISMYYDTFKQPLNLLNWIGKLSQKHDENKHQSQTQLMPQLSKINQLLKKNSVQIDTRVSLREYLKDKNMFNVTLDIDANGNGQISKQQLIDYMNKHNVVVDQSQIEGQSINLVSFLKKYGK